MQSLSGKARLWAVALCAPAILAPPALRADATIRYEYQMTPAVLMPAGMPHSQIVRIKGNKAWYQSGDQTFVLDLAKQEMTLMDAAGKTYATTPLSQYAKLALAAMPEAPAGVGPSVQDILAKMKTTTQSKVTGKTDSILGVQAAEREVDFTIEIPMPEGMPISSMSMKMVVHIWSAKPEEALRLPAVRELSALNQWQKYALNLGELFQNMPGAGSGASIVDELSKDQSVILRTTMEMQMGGMPGLENIAGAGFQMKMEATEISAAPVDDSLFQIPKDYDRKPFDQILKATIADLTHPAKLAAEGAAPPQPAGVKAYAPSLSPLSQESPAYPAEARAQNIYGDVQLLLTLDAQGNVTEAEPLTGPKLLRQPAIDSAMKWKFRPVLRDGKPVTALTDVSVDFSEPDGGFHPGEMDLADEMSATERLKQLKEAMPRTPQQTLADLEQDSGGGDADRRYYALDSLADAAMNAGDTDKAVAYANELLSTAAKHSKDWHTGDAIHAGNTVLGLAALERGDAGKAGDYLLKSAQTDGSPVLGSFGPTMKLAKALLDKGERNVVLQYLSLCRAFWEKGRERLDQWAQDIAAGKSPDFSFNMR